MALEHPNTLSDDQNSSELKHRHTEKLLELETALDQLRAALRVFSNSILFQENTNRTVKTLNDVATHIPETSAVIDQAVNNLIVGAMLKETSVQQCDHDDHD